MFVATCSVLKNIINEGSFAQKADVDAAFDAITSFEFILILHLMKEMLSITDDLCQALQRKSQDILNAMSLVFSTKELIQKLRECGWDSLLEDAKLFCEKHGVEIPDLHAQYTAGRGRPRRQNDSITLEYHYRVDTFIATIDSMLQELNNKFLKNSIELLTLSAALDPKDGFKLFKVDDICNLA